MWYRIRPAERRDASAIAEIRVLAWQQAYRGLLPDSILESLSVESDKIKIEETFLNTDRKPLIVVCDDDDRPIGYCIWSDIEKKIELDAIYVHPDFQRQGAGSALVTAIMDQTKKSLCVWTIRNNASAIMFYQALGFFLDGSDRERKLGESLVCEIRLVRGRN